MKKVLVLMLVLGMASMASAGLVITDNADGTGVTVSSDDQSTYTAFVGPDCTGATMTANVGPDSVITPDPYGYAGYFKLQNLDFDGTVIDISPGAHFIIAAPLLTNVLLYDDSFMTVIGSAVVTPEPMTIGLLGLGTLLLRRRK